MSICTNLFEEFPLEIQIAHILDDVEWNCVEVIHSGWFLFWNPAPGARIICGSTSYDVTPAHAFLIPAYTTISGFSEKKFPHLYTHFTVGAPFDKVENRIYLLDPGAARNFYENHRDSTGIEYILRWRILIMEYLAQLPPESFGGSHQLDERLRRALKAAEKVKNPDNTFLARAAGMSVNNFCRCFRRELKISPRRYFISMRLNAARNMLALGNCTIAEAAQRSGFADRYQFSKSFKEYFGVAPGAFLRQEKQKKI